MRIDVLNGYIINTEEINIHDYIFKDFKFDYIQKSMSISLIDAVQPKEQIAISYYNVLGFNMISSDMWGKSPYVLDWEFVSKEEQVLIPELFAVKNKYQYISSRLDDKIDYMETIITFNSGDTLRVSCEYIVFTKKILY